MITATLFIAGTMLAAKSLGTDTLGAPLHPLQTPWAICLRSSGSPRSVKLRPKIRAPNGDCIYAYHLATVTLMFANRRRVHSTTAISFLNPCLE
jgi:hypothetical protein